MYIYMWRERKEKHSLCEGEIHAENQDTRTVCD